jgi:hypothetical protein
MGFAFRAAGTDPPHRAVVIRRDCPPVHVPGKDATTDAEQRVNPDTRTATNTTIDQ